MSTGIREVGEGAFDEEEGCSDIDGDEAVEEGLVGVLDFPCGDDAGIVDEAVDFPEGGEGGIDDPLGSALGCEIVDVKSGGGTEFLGGGFGEVWFEAVDEDGGTLRDTAFGDGVSDAGGRTGNDDRFTFEAHDRKVVGTVTEDEEKVGAAWENCVPDEIVTEEDVG